MALLGRIRGGICGQHTPPAPPHTRGNDEQALRRTSLRAQELHEARAIPSVGLTSHDATIKEGSGRTARYGLRGPERHADLLTPRFTTHSLQGGGRCRLVPTPAPGSSPA